MNGKYILQSRLKKKNIDSNDELEPLHHRGSKVRLNSQISSNSQGELHLTISSRKMAGSSQFRSLLTSSSQHRSNAGHTRKYLHGLCLVSFSGFMLKLPRKLEKPTWNFLNQVRFLMARDPGVIWKTSCRMGKFHEVLVV